MWLTSVLFALFTFIASTLGNYGYYPPGGGYYPGGYNPPGPYYPPATNPPSPAGTTLSPTCGPPGGCTCDCQCPAPGAGTNNGGGGGSSSGGGGACPTCPPPINGNGTLPNTTLSGACIQRITAACSPINSAGVIIGLLLNEVLTKLTVPILMTILFGDNTPLAAITLASELCYIIGLVLCLLCKLGLLGLFGPGSLLAQVFGQFALTC